MFRFIQKFAIATIVFLVLFIAIFKSVDAQMMGQGMMGGQTSVADNSDGHHESLDQVLAELLAKYNKDTIQELNCNDLTDEEIERVGDAVMESMHPGEAHERMDAMMGGEGSESLRFMHLQMGQRYLGCNTSTIGGWSGGMMGMGSLGSMMDGKVSGYQWPLGGIHKALIVITWLTFMAFLIAGVRWLWKKGSTAKK